MFAYFRDLKARLERIEARLHDLQVPVPPPANQFLLQLEAKLQPAPTPELNTWHT